MALSFKVVDVPKVAGGHTPQPNPFEPAAKAAVQAQEQGKAIAFPLDTSDYTDITTVTEVDGKKVTKTKTAKEQAEFYVVRKIRELGKQFDRTFTVVVTGDDEDGYAVTLAAKKRIVREKKTVDVAVPTEA